MPLLAEEEGVKFMMRHLLQDAQLFGFNGFGSRA